MHKNLEYKYKIYYEQEFREDLREIYLYVRYNLKEEFVAKRMIKEIIEKIKILEDFPLAYRLIKIENCFQYRRFIVKNYFIIYKIDLESREIYILNIFYQKRKTL